MNNLPVIMRPNGPLIFIFDAEICFKLLCADNNIIIIIGTHEFMGMPPRLSPSGNINNIQLSYINTCLP